MQRMKWMKLGDKVTWKVGSWSCSSYPTFRLLRWLQLQIQGSAFSPRQASLIQINIRLVNNTAYDSSPPVIKDAPHNEDLLRHQTLANMINAVLVFNNAGQPRLTKFYTQLVDPPPLLVPPPLSNTIRRHPSSNA